LSEKLNRRVAHLEQICSDEMIDVPEYLHEAFGPQMPKSRWESICSGKHTAEFLSSIGNDN